MGPFRYQVVAKSSVAGQDRVPTPAEHVAPSELPPKQPSAESAQ